VNLKALNNIRTKEAFLLLICKLSDLKSPFIRLLAMTSSSLSRENNTELSKKEKENKLKSTLSGIARIRLRKLYVLSSKDNLILHF
jgi:hypothetical protein